MICSAESTRSHALSAMETPSATRRVNVHKQVDEVTRAERDGNKKNVDFSNEAKIKSTRSHALSAMETLLALTASSCSGLSVDEVTRAERDGNLDGVTLSPESPIGQSTRSHALSAMETLPQMSERT